MTELEKVLKKSTPAQRAAYIEIMKREISRRRIDQFIQYTYPKYDMTWFHEIYCKIIQSFCDGLLPKLMLSVPPQHGKSLVSTRSLPAYLLGHDPSLKVAIISYSTMKAWKFGRDIKLVMTSQEYKNLFPDTKLPEKKNAKYSNSNDVVDIPAGKNDKGNLFMVGRGGGLTGDPVDVLLMDDLYKDAAEANSPVIRQNVIDWYDTVAESRLHNNSKQLIVFTRWHNKDLIGYIEDNEDVITLETWKQLEEHDPKKWLKVNFEAIKTGKPTEIDPRKPGEALYPDRHSLEKLGGTKIRLLKNEPEKWYSLYQGDPKPLSGLLYTGFKTYISVPATYKTKAYVDVADQGKDFLCCVVYGDGVDKHMYGYDIYYTNASAEITEEHIADMFMRNRVDAADFESNAGGRSYARNIERILKARGWTRTEINTFHQSGNKETRILTNATNVQRVFMMPKNWINKWPQFAEDVLTFKKVFKSNARDDAPDTLTGCYEKTFNSSNELFIASV